MYSNTQKPAWVAILGYLHIAPGIFLVLTSEYKTVIVIGISLIILGLLLSALFNGLTVSVSKKNIVLKFGCGLIKKTIEREGITDVKIVRNKAIYGWGIRLTPHGWLWNIHGLDAIELSLQNGKTFRVGTNEPKALLEVLSKKIDD